MTALIASASTGADHVKGFVTSYAKCWEHYEAYMQNPDHTYQGFIDACKAEAAEQGIEIKLPAPTTFRNRTAKLKQAGVIPERTVSNNPEAVKKRKQREKGTNAQIGQMSPDQSTTPTPANTNDEQDVRSLQSTEGPSPLLEPEIVDGLQVGRSPVDIRSFTPVLEQLCFGIEAARRNSDNTIEEWGSLTAILQGLYHHAQCETKQRRLRRERESA